jgi:DNA polymerase III alpha subunit
MYIDKAGNKWYQVGLHMHTLRSDGRVSPEEMARIYKNAGFDAVAITDHWKFHEAGNINGLNIIAGCEYDMVTTDAGIECTHIVGFGMRNDPKLDRKTATRQGIIDAINANGGSAVLAHPHWSLTDKKQIMSLEGLSFIEIYNTVSDVAMSNRADSSYIVDTLANDGFYLPLIATDDVHYYAGHDEARSFVRVKAESGKTEDILHALKNGDFYASQGPHLEVRREGNKIIAECSPCHKLAFMSNVNWAPDRMVRSECVTGAEYTIKEHEKWVRVEVTDFRDNRAWSNIIVL